MEYLDWTEDNVYSMECRYNYLSKQTNLHTYEIFELEDLRTKILHHKEVEEKINKNRKEVYALIKEKQEKELKEKEIALQHERQLFKDNTNIPASMYEDLKEYLDSHTDTEFLIKINITMNIKKLQDLIQDDKINYCNDTELNKLINKCLEINKKKYIYKKNAVKMIVDYIKEIIEKLKTINKELYEKSKEKRNADNNNWAKQKCNCEFCGKEISKGNKTKHLNACKQNPNN